MQQLASIVKFCGLSLPKEIFQLLALVARVSDFLISQQGNAWRQVLLASPPKGREFESGVLEGESECWLSFLFWKKRDVTKE